MMIKLYSGNLAVDFKQNKETNEMGRKSIFGGDEKWKSRRRKAEGRKSILKHIVK